MPAFEIAREAAHELTAAINLEMTGIGYALRGPLPFSVEGLAGLQERVTQVLKHADALRRLVHSPMPIDE